MPDPNESINFLVVICREGETEATPFEDVYEARKYYETAGNQWSDSYLCQVLPRNESVSPTEAAQAKIARLQVMAKEIFEEGWECGNHAGFPASEYDWANSRAKAALTASPAPAPQVEPDFEAEARRIIERAVARGCKALYRPRRGDSPSVGTRCYFDDELPANSRDLGEVSGYIYTLLEDTPATYYLADSLEHGHIYD